ncbi:ROK family protein, partial [Kineococcus glutinatus]|uniref:ROK family protein n=1 Tax=Kineococcus glutinatus TaxID=1070872 RepID=UPI0031EDE2DF
MAPEPLPVPAPGSWTAGVDVGGTKVLGVLLDGAGAVHGRVRVPTGRGSGDVVAAVAAVVDRLRAGAGLAPGELDAVGVGVPGLVDPFAGTVAHAVNLGIGADPVPLGALLADGLGGVPVVLENDLNAATLGAAATPGLDGDLALLALGTGLAAGLLLDGRLRRGAHG